MWNKNLLLLIQGQAVSCLGSTLYSVVASLWAYGMTGSVLIMSAVYSASNLARLIMFPFAGLIVDRFPRRNLIVVSDILCGISILIVALAAATGMEGAVWTLVMHSAVTGAVSGVFNPAVNTLMLSLARKEHYVRVNSIYGTIEYGVDLVGQAVAGSLYVMLGAPLLFFLNGITFLFSAGTEMFITPDPKPVPSQRQPIGKEALEGVAYILKHKGVGLNLLLAFCINFAFGVLKVLLVPWMLTFGESCYGLLGTFRSAGVLAGTLLLAVWSIPQRKQYGVYFWTQIVFVVCIALAACMPHFWPIAVLFFIAYANQYVFNTLQRSAVIIAAPDAIRGKVICAIQALAMGFSALGNVAGGVIGEQYAPQPLLMGLMLALLVAIIFLGRNKSVRGLFVENGTEN